MQKLCMDALDRRLLNLLQLDSRLTAGQLAQRLPLSASAIARRMKRLREDGSIATEVAILSPRLREKGINAIITVQLERHQASEWEELKRQLLASHEVQMCFEITGTSDVLVIVAARDMRHFNEFADTLAAHSLVRRYETNFVKRQVKLSLAVFLDDAAAE